MIKHFRAGGVKNQLQTRRAIRYSPRVSGMRKRVEVFYAGRVQGVGFRWTTREIAKGFEVAGHVRNLTDGRVELVAEGEEEELRQFLDTIREGELGGYIRGHQESWKETTGSCKGFVITH